MVLSHGVRVQALKRLELLLSIHARGNAIVPHLGFEAGTGRQPCASAIPSSAARVVSDKVRPFLHSTNNPGNVNRRAAAAVKA